MTEFAWELHDDIDILGKHIVFVFAHPALIKNRQSAEKRGSDLFSGNFGSKMDTL